MFHQEYEGLLLAEVEFSSQEEAESYCPPDWFGEDVTFSVRYHNSTLSRGLTENNPPLLWTVIFLLRLLFIHGRAFLHFLQDSTFRLSAFFQISAAKYRNDPQKLPHNPYCQLPAISSLIDCSRSF